jgi:Ca2+-binding EF-hand superfamily protein
MKKILLVSTIVIGLLTVSFLEAASHRKQVYLNQYDLNKNGDLIEPEFNQARRQQFNLTDEDNDGVVGEKEYVFEYTNRMDKQLIKDRKGQVKQTIVRFKSLDKSENKKMEWEEYQTSGLRSFKYYDVNKDGIINENDPVPVRKSRKKSLKNKTVQDIADEKQNKLRYAKRLLRMPTTHDREGFFTKYDLDENAIINKKEFDVRRRQDFDRADENNNDWLSEREYIFEYENRLDKQITKTRKAAIKQTYVRFGVLDDNKDSDMTFLEYQSSGKRSFSRWDTDKNGIVNMQDPMPEKRKHSDKDKTAKSVSAY